MTTRQQAVSRAADALQCAVFDAIERGVEIPDVEIAWARQILSAAARGEVKIVSVSEGASSSFESRTGAARIARPVLSGVK